MSRTALKSLLLVMLPIGLHGQIQITLKNSFIERYKNRVTIHATYTVDKAHQRPNAPSKDGDLHIAGRAPEIGLPIVAEIMNAGSADSAVALVHAAEGTGRSIDVLGAWRIWCEHGGESRQVQGATLAPFLTTNPDHVFEIHPILRVDGDSIPDSWVPVQGYTPKEADQAFERYENTTSDIRVNTQRGTATIVTSMVGFNYAEFKAVLQGEQKEVEDGRFVMADVLDLTDELLVRNRRMVFAKGTPPELKVKTLQVGDTLHVLGVPRVDLSLVSWRVRNRATRPDALRWNLPYEMIIVGIY